MYSMPLDLIKEELPQPRARHRAHRQAPAFHRVAARVLQARLQARLLIAHHHRVFHRRLQAFLHRVALALQAPRRRPLHHRVRVRQARAFLHQVLRRVALRVLQVQVSRAVHHRPVVQAPNQETHCGLGRMQVNREGE